MGAYLKEKGTRIGGKPSDLESSIWHLMHTRDQQCAEYWDRKWKEANAMGHEGTTLRNHCVGWLKKRGFYDPEDYAEGTRHGTGTDYRRLADGEEIPLVGGLLLAILVLFYFLSRRFRA